MKDFQSQTFCLTGVIPGIARADILSHIAARDGEFTDRMNKSVTILIVGERGQGTNKYEKALQYGTEIMEYEEFMRWMMRTPLVDKDAHLVNLQRGSSRKYLGGAHVVPPSALRHQPSTPPQPSALSPQPSFDWSKFWSSIAAILVIIYKGALVVAGLSLCVVFWLIGIPVSPSSLPR
jgi:hypothetical protein